MQAINSQRFTNRLFSFYQLAWPFQVLRVVVQDSGNSFVLWAVILARQFKCTFKVRFC